MERPSSSSSSAGIIIGALMAAAITFRPLRPSYSMRMEKGAYRISHSRYSPCPTPVRNPKIAAQNECDAREVVRGAV
jgi:hypothetical protein